MAKKQQFAGKKTKLAKLHLTLVLARQTDEPSAYWNPEPVSDLGAGKQPLSQERLEKDASHPLAVTYFQLIRGQRIKGRFHLCIGKENTNRGS